MLFNRDLAANAWPKFVARACMAVLDAIQFFRKEEQALAVAVIFLQMCRRFDLRPNDIFQYASNVIGSDRPEYRAVKAYIQNEL